MILFMPLGGEGGKKGGVEVRGSWESGKNGGQILLLVRLLGWLAVLARKV